VLLLSLALLVGVVLVAFVWHKSSRDGGVMRDMIEEEAEDAREVLMPGANGNGDGTSARDYGAINGSGDGTMSPTQENRGRRM